MVWPAMRMVTCRRGRQARLILRRLVPIWDCRFRAMASAATTTVRCALMGLDGVFGVREQRSGA